MNRAVEIRDYEFGDGAICHDLRRSAFLGVFNGELSQDVVAAGAESYGVSEFVELIGSLRTCVATLEGVVVGFCSVRLAEPDTAEMLYLYIDGNCRGLGAGTQLLQHADDESVCQVVGDPDAPSRT